MWGFHLNRRVFDNKLSWWDERYTPSLDSLTVISDAAAGAAEGDLAINYFIGDSLIGNPADGHHEDAQIVHLPQDAQERRILTNFPGGLVVRTGYVIQASGLTEDEIDDNIAAYYQSQSSSSNGVRYASPLPAATQVHINGFGQNATASTIPVGGPSEWQMIDLQLRELEGRP